jgi:AcrR family transcriptional regulator
MESTLLNPVGQRKQQSKAETRSLILDSARSLFEEKGYEKTTIRQVAIGAGIGLGTIFKHFPGKSALLSAAFYDDIDEEMRSAFKEVPDQIPVEQQLLHVFGHFYLYYARRPALSRVLLQKLLFVEDDEWGQRVAGQLLSMINRLAELLQTAQARGDLGPEANCQAAAYSLFAQYLFTLVTCLSFPPFDPDEALSMLEILVQQLMQGMVKGDHQVDDGPR